MNAQFKSSSKLTRSMFALAAVLSSVLVLTGIAGLADHYRSDTQTAVAERTAGRA